MLTSKGLPILLLTPLFFLGALADALTAQDLGRFAPASHRLGDEGNLSFGLLRQEPANESQVESSEEPPVKREEDMEEVEIETDRDSFTPSTSTVGCGQTVFEGAYTFIDNREVPETHSFPEFLVRYGILANVELRFGWNYEIGGAGSPVSGNVPSDLSEDAELEEESRALYGAKFDLTEQCSWVPGSSLIVQGFTPTSGEATDSQVSVTHVFGWKLPNERVLDFGNRFSTSSLDHDDFNVWSPSSVLKMPVGERWRAHVEYFGVFTDGREAETVQHFVSPGAHYLITPDREVGARFGWGLNEQSPNFFINVGLGLRF